jgi:putative hydrolase of the HAD superfamily
MCGGRPYDAVLFAVDGVLRLLAEDGVPAVERRYDLPAGALSAAIADGARLDQALSGLITDEEWRAGVAGALVPDCGAQRAIEAVADWSADMGRVDVEALEVLRAIRKAVPVALVANGTTRLELELVMLGLADEVDVVASSARVGVPAPEPDLYTIAAGLVRAAPGRCLYVDTDGERLRGAEAAGMTVHRYVGAEQLRAELAALLDG